jgi:acetylornithine deacetylase/succinyl-diaminopimelate desuccinylase-like protein
MPASSNIHERPLELLQNLIRFDTTNPPGNEGPCIEYIAGLLKEAGIEFRLVARDPNRPNLIARLKGRGEAPPLLLYGHVDVVTTANQRWTYPPFEGRIADGYLWGRGALDMKGPLTVLLAAFLKAKAEGLVPPGDVLFAAVADEEAGDEYGVRYLVAEHSGLFEGVRYAFGEFGGFNMTMAGKRVYPIMVAEKQICWMKATFRGLGGHASMPVRGQAMARLGRALTILDRQPLPVHITPAVRLMFTALADVLGGMNGVVIRLLLAPPLTDAVLKLLASRGNLFANLFHNTVSPTMLQASDKVNVIPSEVTLGMDGRMLPGMTAENMLSEVRGRIGRFADVEVVRSDPGPAAPDMGLFDTLGGVLQELDPQGTAIPFVLGAVTDARFLSKLGIQTYGFTPLKLPEDFNFLSGVHGADERIPVDALDFGVEAVFRALQRFK